jgi:lipopolysaccharide exporter
MTAPEDDSDIRLGARIVRGGAWLAGIQVTVHGLALLRLLIVARVLAPSDLGILGMALLTLAVLKIVSETGVDQSLIQRRDLPPGALHTAWTLLAVRGIVLAVLLFLPGAAAMVWFFDEPAAGPLARVLALSVLTEGFLSLGPTLTQKAMEFRRLFFYQVSALLGDFVVTITLLVITRSVWSLVFGILTGSLVRLVGSYVIHPYRPRLRFEREDVGRFVGYGKWLTLSSILGFLLLQGDDLFVGKLFGAVVLGYYQVAYRISNLPATGLSQMLGRVLLPAYSKIQDDLARLGRLFVRSLTLTSLLVFPTAALIAGLSGIFTPVLLGERWLPIVPLLQVLALYGLLRAIGGTTGAVFLSVGRPDIRTRIHVGQFLLLLAVIYPLARWQGALGVGLAVAIYALVFNLYAVVRVLRYCSLGAGTLRAALLWPALAGGLMVSALLLAGGPDRLEPSLPVLIGLTAGATLLYLALMLLFDRFERGRYGRELKLLRAAFADGPGGPS